MPTAPKPERHAKTSLWQAVHAFQGEAIKLQKDKLNPAFRSKYLSLDALHEQVMPVLNKHGLIWLTAPNHQAHGGEVQPTLSYRLIHAETGEETSGTVPLMLTKRDPQGLGSAITYARRYALMAVLGLVADEDDDGNQASQGRSQAARQTSQNGHRVSASPARATTSTATARQRGLINGKAGEKALPPIDLANIVLAATESELRTFETQSDAEEWLRRAMDRLPASAVDAVLAGIEQADPQELPL